MNLTLQQKQQALKLRKSFWVEMGRLLWYREKLLLQLQDAAMQLENEAEADLATWISQPLPICRQVSTVRACHIHAQLCTFITNGCCDMLA